MLNKKSKVDIIFNSDEFNNTDKYNIEKRYAFARFYYPYFPLFSNLKESEKYCQISEDYSNSLISKIKKDYKNNALTKEDHERVEKNLLMVPVIIRNLKSGKERVINEPMLPDSLIIYLQTKKDLNFYLSKLNDYKQTRDNGTQQFLIFDYGKEYSTKEEFRNIKMLIETTRNALTLINSPNCTKEDEKLAINWSMFLNKTVEVNSVYVEGIYLPGTIDILPEFNKLELNKINETNKSILNRLEILENNEMQP